jgi:carbonic anhydrase
VNIHAIGVQVNVPPGNVLTTGGQKWELLQYHFHTPSEHSLDGRHAAMEAHLVHRNQATGALAVVGVLLEPETTITSAVFCSALEQALWLVPDASGASSAPHTLEADTFTGLIPGINGGSSTTLYPHVHYNGSLTTPPCTEGLSWYVLLKPSPVGAAQVIRFQRLLGNGLTLDTNARPVQPLRGRVFVH